MMKKLTYIFFGFFTFYLPPCFGQSSCNLIIKKENSTNTSYKSVFSDSTNASRESIKFLNKQKSKGYISAYYDTISYHKNSMELSLKKGLLYSWKKLFISPLASSILNKKINLKKQFNPEEINSLIQNLITACENNGYPFAEIRFDSTQIEVNKITSILNIELNQYVEIDSIEIKGEIKTSRNYIQKQIEIEKGDTYNESKISQISNKINNLTFLQEIRTSEVYFTKNKARLVLYLKENSASKFDGILGINNDEKTGEISFVGNLKINLLNAFKQGENIILNWQRAKTLSQRYLLDLDYPFLFQSRIGLSTGVNYYRQDTSFANLNAKLGLYFFINHKQKLGILTRLEESNSLTNFQLPSSGIPDVNSVSTIYYGMDYSFNSLDYKLNPRKGINISTEIATGDKRIKKNSLYSSNEYEEITEKTTQIKSQLSIAAFLPLFRKSTLLIRLNSGALFASNIFENEVYQLGGLKTLRGFNEQSIFASKYLIGTAEYRFLFDRNSSFFGFFDMGAYENKAINKSVEDTPFGFGLGVNFQVKSGIFSLSYGLGKQKDNPILIKNGKIHFGFVSLF